MSWFSGRSGEIAATEIAGNYPGELQPLVDEINQLVRHNATVMERARTHVGNLAHALKSEDVDAKEWGVLYLGSTKAADAGAPLVALDRRGKPLPDQAAALSGLKGLVVLDARRDVAAGETSILVSVCRKQPMCVEVHLRTSLTIRFI